VSTLPGSHNNVFTEPDQVAELVVRAATGPGLPVRPTG